MAAAATIANRRPFSYRISTLSSSVAKSLVDSGPQLAGRSTDSGSDGFLSRLRRHVTGPRRRQKIGGDVGREKQWSVRRLEAQRGHGFLKFSPELESEATAGIEPAMKVLQTSALPLGYVAMETRTDAFGAARVVQV